MSTYRQKRLRLRGNPNSVFGWPSELESGTTEKRNNDALPTLPIDEINNDSVPTLPIDEINNDSVPTLPIDLLTEIFCRLAVKLLLRLRCVCKSWNSLISDRNFTRKHLSLSTTRRLHYVKYKYKPHEFIHGSYPLESVLTNIPTKFTERRVDLDSIVGSCDGILCISDKSKGSVVLWNPSIRKFKETPPFENTEKVYTTYGFGYDHVSDNYKLVALYYSETNPNLVDTTIVKVHTVGTNFWTTIRTFPFGAVFDERYGAYVRGTINWIAYTEWKRKGPLFIVSFDLGNDSYQKLLPPDHLDTSLFYLKLSVLRDCLCLIFDHHIWVMKEYGIHESWTKLFSVSYMQDPNKCYFLFKALYIFDDDRVLLDTEEDSKRKLVVYDPKNDTFKVTRLKNYLNVCLESLISPCS